MKTLIIDEKWSVVYDPAQNDKPVYWARYEEMAGHFTENNAVLAMFYALLEART